VLVKEKKGKRGEKRGWRPSDRLLEAEDRRKIRSQKKKKSEMTKRATGKNKDSSTLDRWRKNPYAAKTAKRH